MPVFNQSRSTIIRLIILGVFAIILAQLVNLQLISGKYKKLAMENALFAKVVYHLRPQGKGHPEQYHPL
jgi:penicillin-binding protein 2